MNQQVSISRTIVFQKLVPSLVMIFLSTAVLMTIYEITKQELHPSITIWQSHTITIVFASFVAPFAAYFWLKKIEVLRLKTNNELIERQKAERELQIIKDELEIRVEERTVELWQKTELLEQKAKELTELNEKLAKSEIDLKELNTSKDKLFSIIAHDLKNPLTSLMGFSELLLTDLNELSKGEIREYTVSIREATINVLNLLENLLKWARMQIASVNFQRSCFMLEKVVKEVLHLNKYSIQKKELEIDFACKGDSNIVADQNMIETVIRNLTTNAIKFTPRKGKIKFLVEDRNDSVYFLIEDSGIGIPEENLSKLFKVDEQITTKGTENELGTGLGLVLCKELLNKNNCDLYVESVLKRGSKFYFEIPRAV